MSTRARPARTARSAGSRDPLTPNMLSWSECAARQHHPARARALDGVDPGIRAVQRVLRELRRRSGGRMRYLRGSYGRTTSRSADGPAPRGTERVADVRCPGCTADLDAMYTDAVALGRTVKSAQTQGRLFAGSRRPQSGGLTPTSRALREGCLNTGTWNNASMMQYRTYNRSRDWFARAVRCRGPRSSGVHGAVRVRRSGRGRSLRGTRPRGGRRSRMRNGVGPEQRRSRMTRDAPILIVDDEDDLRELLDLHLRREGFQTMRAATAAEALALAGDEPPLVVLDLMLPGHDGDRGVSSTAGRSATRPRSRDHAHRQGRGDRSRRRLRGRRGRLRGQGQLLGAGVRPAGSRGPSAPPRVPAPVAETVAHHGLLEIDVGRPPRVRLRSRRVDLTATEFKLLMSLATRPERVQTRGFLLEEVWDLPPDLNTRTVDTHVKRLREKLGTAQAHLQTVRGVGYRFCGRSRRGCHARAGWRSPRAEHPEGSGLRAPRGGWCSTGRRTDP